MDKTSTSPKTPTPGKIKWAIAVANEKVATVLFEAYYYGIINLADAKATYNALLVSDPATAKIAKGLFKKAHAALD